MDAFLAVLNNVTKDIWIAVWTAFVTTVTALISTWMSNSNNRKTIKAQHEHTERMFHQKRAGERLEELYELAGKWISKTVNDSTHLQAVLSGLIPYTTYAQGLLADSPDLSRLELLVHVQDHEIGEAYNLANDIRRSINGVEATYTEALSDRERAGVLLEQLSALQAQFIDAASQFKTAIATAAREV